MVELLIMLPCVYVAGSVNCSIGVLKLLGKADPSKVYSGNPGTTNVYRQAGMIWAAVVLLLEVGRAVGAALATLWLLPLVLVPWVGLALIVGNRFPLFHGFKGGKGVANFLGFTLVLAPMTAGLSALSWVALFSLVRITFVASFLMTAVLAVGTFIWSGWHPQAIVATSLVAGLILEAHRSNISRLLEERRERLDSQAKNDVH